MDKIVIYDTETTNSTIWGSIIEVGAVVVDKNLKEIGKLILNAPAEMVIILNGIGVKPAVNTIKKLYRSNFCCIAVNSSVENPGIWLKKNNATLEYSPILFHQAKYPIA